MSLRLSLARIWSAGLVQEKGWQCSFQLCLIPERYEGTLARDLPETALRATSLSPTTQSPAALLTCAVVWSREVPYGGVNRPRIDGKDGVAGSIPVEGFTRNTAAAESHASSAACTRAENAVTTRGGHCRVRRHERPARTSSFYDICLRQTSPTSAPSEPSINCIDA